MAAAYVSEDLRCHICRTPYTDPVSLQCGHRFCRSCIVHELDIQQRRRAYSCPKCGEQFDERPPLLHKKRRLRVDIPCRYCDDPVPAVKTCLHCDASLCAKHLSKHSTAPEHILIEPTTSPEDRKCAKHRQVLDYFCTEDHAFICLLCYLFGEHEGHEVAALKTNYTKKEQHNLCTLIRTLTIKRQTIDSQINSLQGHEAAKIDATSKSVVGQIQNLKKELDDLQKKILLNLYAHQKEFLISVADWERKLEDQREEMSKKIDNFEKLRNTRDTMTFLKETLDTDLIGIFSDEPGSESAPLFDDTPISVMLHEELLKFSDRVNKQMLKEDFPKRMKSDIALDIKTAHCNIIVNNNLSTAFYHANRQARDSGPERFRSHHVLSKFGFSSGNHYWEVEVEGTQWSIGMAYDNIERKTTKHESRIGQNKSSWSLSSDTELSVWHNCVETKIYTDSPERSFGVFLEYNAGRLSFYQLCDPIRHLHTFTTTFTRPLHAAFYIFEGSKVTILN